MGKRRQNNLAYKHRARARARERMDRGHKLAHSGYMAEARRELDLARDDFNDGREPKVHARLGRVLVLDGNLQAEAAELGALTRLQDRLRTLTSETVNFIPGRRGQPTQRRNTHLATGAIPPFRRPRVHARPPW